MVYKLYMRKDCDFGPIMQSDDRREFLNWTQAVLFNLTGFNLSAAIADMQRNAQAKPGDVANIFGRAETIPAYFLNFILEKHGLIMDEQDDDTENPVTEVEPAQA